MATSIVQTSSIQQTTLPNSGGTISVAGLSSNATTGNLLIMSVTAGSVNPSTYAITTPSGWTLVTSAVSSGVNNCCFLYYKFAGSSDNGANSLVTSSGGSQSKSYQIQMQEISGANTSTPITAYQAISNATGSITTSILNPAALNSLDQVFATTRNNYSSWTTPSGYTTDSIIEFNYDDAIFAHNSSINSSGAGSSITLTSSVGDPSCAIWYYINPVAPVSWIAHPVQGTVGGYQSASVNDSNTSWGHTATGTTGLTLTAGNWYSGTYRPVGDLLVAFVCVTSNNKALSSFVTPSGWSLLTSYSTTNYDYCYILYKTVISPTDLGNFSTTINSSSSQICSYVIEVVDIINGGIPSQSADVTASTGTMTCTLTPQVANSVGLVAFMDSNSNGGAQPTFGGTATTWYTPPDGNHDTSGGVACYASFTSSTTPIPSSSVTATAVTSARTKPLFAFVIVPPFQIQGFYDSLPVSTYTPAPSSMMYNSYPSDTSATFSSSSSQKLTALNSISQTDSFSSNVTQTNSAKNTQSQTMSFSSSVSQMSAVNSALANIGSFVSSVSQNQSVLNTISQTDSFSSSVSQIQIKQSAISDTIVNFVSNASQTLASGSSLSDRTVSFVNSISSIANFKTQLNNTSTFSSSGSALQFKNATVSDVVSTLSSLPSINAMYKISISGVSNFNSTLSAFHQAVVSVSDSIAHGDSVASLARFGNEIYQAQSFVDSARSQITQSVNISQTDSFSSSVSDNIYASVLLAQVDAFSDYIAFAELIVAPLTQNIFLSISASININQMALSQYLSLNQFSLKSSIPINLPVKAK